MVVTSVRGTRNFVGGLTVIVGLAALGLEACSGNGASEDLGSVAQPVYDFDEDAGIFQSTPVDPQLRAQVVVSLWKPGKWSQAGASNQGDGCSGILVTPRAVLTAASCAKRLNTTSFDVFVGPRTPDVAAPGETVKFQSESIVSFGTPASEPSLSGRDVAIVFLKTPVLEAAFIHRPPLSTPSALSGPDSDGGSPYAVGISGWSPFTAVPGLNDPPAATVRQTFFKDSVGGNDEIRLTWHSGLPLWSATAFRPVTGLPKVGPAPGDNGGPLFVHGPSDRLDVIGVASVIGAPADPLLTPSYDWAALPARQQELCQTPASAPSPPDITPYDCIFWVDVTSEPVKGWLLSTLVDTTRGPDWLKSHPRVGEGQSGLPWIGEVDYTGPCQQSADADCDHVYTSNADGSRRDNCPTLANPDQKDSLDLGVGDACVAGQTLTLTDGGVSQVLNEPVGVMRTSGGSIVIADWGNNDVSYMQTPASSPQTWLRGSRNRISNPRAEVAGAGVPGWIIASGSWSIGTRSNCASPCQFSPFDGAAWFNGVRGAAALGRMTQTLNLVDQASFISTGVMRAVISANVQVPMGAARLLVEYLDFAGAVIGTYDSGAISAVAAPSWTPIENEHAVPTAARAARIALEVPSGQAVFDGLQFRLINTAQGFSDARMTGPSAVAQAANGDIYVGANGIWRYTQAGTFTKIGNGAGYVPPRRVTSIAPLADGWLYFADPTSSTVHVRASNGAGYYATLQPSGGRVTAVVAAPQGTSHRLWVAFANLAQVSYFDCPKSSQSGAVVTCTRQGTIGSTPGFVDDLDGTAGGERLGYMNGLGLGLNQELLITEESNHAVRQHLSPFTSTVSGTGIRGFVDGRSNTARFSSPSGLTVLPTGQIVVADRGNHRLRLIYPPQP